MFGASTALGIVDHLRRRSAPADSFCGEFARFKSATGRTRCGEPCAHFLDLRCLLVELGCESLYLFLLLRDRCFQLLNFVIEHGLALGARSR